MSIRVLFTFLMALFALGGIGIFAVSRNQEKDKKRKAWTKYFVYFFIINTLFVSIFYFPAFFRVLCGIIVLGGGFELIRLQYNAHQLAFARFGIFLLIYILVSALFILSGFERQDMLLFTLLIVCSFDAFSQLSGQLFGKRKISPAISPNKTVGGTLGGTVATVAVSIATGHSLGWGIPISMCMGLGIAGASFAGDLSASYVKRQYGVKDFSRMLPEHGGFLDRFDSLMLAGAFVYIFQLFR